MKLQLSLYQYAAITTLLLAFYFTLNVYSITLYFIALGAGYFVAPLLLKHENVEAIQGFLLTSFELIEKPKPEPVKAAPIVLRKNRTASTASTNISVNVPPWEELEVPARVNEAAEELILVIIDNYINKWYKAGISADNAFIGEIQYQIRYAASLLLKETKAFDTSSFVLKEWLPLILAHLARIIKQMKAEKTPNVPVLEIDILKVTPDLHIAMTSRENEIDYLRVVADFIVERLVDDTRVAGRSDDFEIPIEGFNKSRPWPSQCVRHFLRELILSSILMPLLDFISNPDTLNNIILSAIQPRQNVPRIELEQIQTRFLAKLTEFGQSDTPDSLLSLKLSEVVKEPRVLQLFYMYLRDIHGPAHYLDCFLQAHDLHNHIHKLKESEILFEELHSDAWQLFSDFIHESAPHRVRFENPQIPEDFHKAVDAKDPILIKKVAEDVYKEMYHRLNYQYLIPFCQSESYLGYLAGAPPDVVELIRGPEEETEISKHKPPPESSFSLSQFRNKFLSAFASANDDEEVPNEEIAVEEEAELDLIENGSIALADMGKDLNKWLVTVPKTEPRTDLSGRTYYVYVIQIERYDLDSDSSSNNSDTDLPMTWSITRKYDEFHILEKKLQEFHGTEVKFGTLPDKRALQQKNRTYMDIQRIQFEKFIQGLVLQPSLKRSELLYAFLTTEEELREDLPLTADLNPFRAMAKVPGKLQRERGQNLKPYLLNVLANILAPTTFYAEAPVLAKEATSDQSSLKSFESEPHELHLLSSKIALDNLMLTQQITQESLLQGNPAFQEDGKLQRPLWTSSTTKIFGFFLVEICGCVSTFFLAVFSLFERFFDRVFEAFMKRQVKKTIDAVVQEETVLFLIQSFQNTILNGSMEASEEEKKLRAELTQRRLDNYLEDNVPKLVTEFVGIKNFRQVATDVIRALQFPRLNKQLAYVLLDALITKARGSNDNVPNIPTFMQMKDNE